MSPGENAGRLDLEVRQLVLERIRLQAHSRLGMEVARDATLDLWTDTLADQLVVALRSYVLGLPTEVVRHRWPATWWDAAKDQLGRRRTWWTRPWCALWAWVRRRWPVTWEQVEVEPYRAVCPHLRVEDQGTDLCMAYLADHHHLEQNQRARGRLHAWLEHKRMEVARELEHHAATERSGEHMLAAERADELLDQLQLELEQLELVAPLTERRVQNLHQLEADLERWVSYHRGRQRLHQDLHMGREPEPNKRVAQLLDELERRDRLEGDGRMGRLGLEPAVDPVWQVHGILERYRRAGGGA